MKRKVTLHEVLNFISSANENQRAKISEATNERRRELFREKASSLNVNQVVWLEFERQKTIDKYGRYLQAVVKKVNPKTVVLLVPDPRSGYHTIRWKVTPNYILTEKPEDFEVETRQDLKILDEEIEDCKKQDIPSRWKQKKRKGRRGRKKKR